MSMKCKQIMKIKISARFILLVYCSIMCLNESHAKFNSFGDAIANFWAKAHAVVKVGEIMRPELKKIKPEDRTSFVELCITKKDECSEEQFSGKRAIFSWKPGTTRADKARFWQTYRCTFTGQLDECPVDGGWAKWSSWTRCKADCDVRSWQLRSRLCNNPRPQFGGDKCEGMGVENKTCIGPCNDAANGVNEARNYVKRMHDVFPGLAEMCLTKHCAYRQVQDNVKDESKVSRYWSSLHCLKYDGACPVNGDWGTWAGWSECSLKCGYGERFRKRICDEPTPKNGGIYCQGEWFQTKICLAKECDDDEVFTDWSNFSPCSESCGAYGLKTAMRSCLNLDLCQKAGFKGSDVVMVVPCYEGECPQPGGWSNWSPWTDCSAACGAGRRTRMRMCDDPYPYNGEDCLGPDLDESSCSGELCNQMPGGPEDDDEEFNEEEMAQLRKEGISTSEDEEEDEEEEDENGNGDLIRKRRSYQRSPNKKYLLKHHEIFISLVNTSKIAYDNLSTTRRTSAQPFSSADRQQPASNLNDNENSSFTRMPVLDSHTKDYAKSALTLTKTSDAVRLEEVDGNTKSILFEERSSNLSSKFGKGVRSRLRVIEKRGTDESSTELQQEAPHLSPEDPYSGALNLDLEEMYTQWTEWQTCSVTCGGGTRTRERKCTNVNIVCRGETRPTQFCNIDPCPVPGGWSAWQAWNPCSVTCGQGVTERYRACDRPLPKFGGSCAGPNKENKPCTAPTSCKKHNPWSWGPWNSWSACSRTCGGGQRSRVRRLRFFAKNQARQETSACGQQPCPVHGMWAAWGGWSICSKDCGLGKTFRDRTCTDPSPVYGGDPCKGQGSEAMACYSGPCGDGDDYGLLFEGKAYLVYPRINRATSFVMVFVRFKIIEFFGTLFHYSTMCKDDLHDCHISILASLVSRRVRLQAKVRKDGQILRFSSPTSLSMRTWQDVFVLVTERWAELRVNDGDRVERRFTDKDTIYETTSMDLDGELAVGANRQMQDGFKGKVAALRRNFKALKLFSNKNVTKRSAPSTSHQVKKFLLASEARHPDFKTRFYSHIHFRESKSIYVSASFQITDSSGLLFFNGGQNGTSYLSAVLRKGAIQLCLNCGSKPVCHEGFTISSGNWYLVSVSVEGNEAEIRLNDGDAIQVNCPADQHYLPRTSLYVGGAGTRDWSVVKKLAPIALYYSGMFDTLSINGQLVTYKMATLVSYDMSINTLGFSVSDLVTELRVPNKTLAVLKCGVPQKIRRAHLVRIVWFHNMRRLLSQTGTAIEDTESPSQAVSQVTLHPGYHHDGVYACVLSEDGVLSVRHVFVLLRYKKKNPREEEGRAEWIGFYIILAVLLFIIIPLLCFYVAKDMACWDRFRNLCRKKRRGSSDDDEDEKTPFLEENPIPPESDDNRTPDTVTEADSLTRAISQVATPESITPATPESITPTTSGLITPTRVPSSPMIDCRQPRSFAELMGLHMPPQRTTVSDKGTLPPGRSNNSKLPCPEPGPPELCHAGGIQPIDFLCNPYYVQGTAWRHETPAVVVPGCLQTQAPSQFYDPLHLLQLQHQNPQMSQQQLSEQQRAMMCGNNYFLAKNWFGNEGQKK